MFTHQGKISKTTLLTTDTNNFDKSKYIGLILAVINDLIQVVHS